MSEVSAMQAAPQTSRLALIALIVGLITIIPLVIVGLMLQGTFQSETYNTLEAVIVLVFPLPDLATLALSIIAWLRIRKSAGRLKGHGLALAGLILGILIPILMIVFLMAAHGPTVCSPAPPPSSGHPTPPC